MAKKGYIYPIMKKIPLILLLNLFGTIIISQFFRFVNRFNKSLEKTFRDTQGSLFMFTYNLSIFLTSTAFVFTNANTAYLFRDMPYFYKTVL